VRATANEESPSRLPRSEEPGGDDSEAIPGIAGAGDEVLQSRLAVERTNVSVPSVKARVIVTSTLVEPTVHATRP
jgi:hypothetical protein